MSLKNSILNYIKHHYESIPAPILNFVGRIGNQFGYGVRYGKSFSETYDELEKTEFLPKAELESMVTDKLLKQIKYAWTHVPYYKKAYKDIDVASLSTVEDIEKLPFIDKSIIKDNEDEFISDLFQKNDLILKKTSGSTGMPLGVYMNKDTTLKEWAYVTHIWKRIGYNAKSSRILMREIEDKSRGICYFDALKNELRIDISQMSPENMEVYCRAIEKYKPNYIHGYPSATLQLCRYIEKRGLKHQFDGVLPTSEGMSEEECEYIKKTLQCPCLSFYGHTERLVIAGQCECSDRYHVEPLYGYCELVDANGNAIHEEYKTGEIVATGFCNTAMPLIRYKTGDLAQWSFQTCSCGRHYKMLEKLEGRKTEYLVDCKNRNISLTSFNYTFYKQHVSLFQFYQNTAGKVTFRVVPESGFCDEDQAYILNSLSEDANKAIDFEIELVDSIEKRPNGKRQMIVQEIREM